MYLNLVIQLLQILILRIVLKHKNVLKKKAADFKDPGTLRELRDKVENDVLKCDTTDEARSKIDEIIRDTISNANKFNEEMR